MYIISTYLLLHLQWAGMMPPPWGTSHQCWRTSFPVLGGWMEDVFPIHPPWQVPYHPLGLGQWRAIAKMAHGGPPWTMFPGIAPCLSPSAWLIFL